MFGEVPASSDLRIANERLRTRWCIQAGSVGTFWLADPDDLSGEQGFCASKAIARAEEAVTGSGFKRLGYLANLLWPNETAVIELARKNRSKGVIRLDPAVKVRGTMNKRWGLWVNVSIAGAAVDS